MPVTICITVVAISFFATCYRSNKFKYQTVQKMPTYSGLWHFLYRLLRKFIRSVVSSEKDMATKTYYYDAFREW